MNPIGAALLACAAAGCAWSAWVSLRGRWRVIVITMSAALAVIVPVVQLGGSTPTTERVSPPLPEPRPGHELAPAPAPAVEVPTAEGAALPAVTEPAVETPVPPVQAELEVAPVAEEARLVGRDDDVELTAQETALVPTDVQPPPAPRLDAVPPTGSAVEVPAAAETPKALRTPSKTTALSPQSSGHRQKKAPRQQDHPKKAKPEPKGERQNH
jgi:hypothetical protein